jgi:hypothetical protein
MTELKEYAKMEKQIKDWIADRNCRYCTINDEDCDMYLCFEVWRNNEEDSHSFTPQ